jgi:glycine/D-amino acid oxidase-like deaminating enzyme
MQGDLRSHGLWEQTAPDAPRTSLLHGEIGVDVVVIGGGYTGLSSALHLAEGGANVAVVEAKEVGFGGAGRNVGLVNAGMWVMPDAVTDELGGLYGERLLDLLGDGPALVFDLIEKHRIDCEVTKTGTLHCAPNQSGLTALKAREAQWLKRGAPVELLGAAETQRRTGSSLYCGALLDRRAGTIQPLAYARGLARAAQQAGAQVFTQSEVTDAHQERGRWVIQTAQGCLRAQWVVVATDAYAVGPWSGLRSEQVHLPYFNFATQPLPSDVVSTILPERQGAWDTKDILTSFRLDQAGRLILGSVGALRGAGLPIHRAWAKRALRKIYPQIGDVSFESEWYGMIGMTDNNLPRFHKLEQNVLAFSGYNGRGIAPGTTFGRVLAGYILGTLSEAELPMAPSELKPPRFGAAQEAFYEIGSQLAHVTSAW